MKRPPDAFTLLEVMVSVTVLAVLLVLFAQILGQTSSTIRAVEKHVDIASTTRIAFDRLGADLFSMVTGNVATLVVVKNAGGSNAGSYSDALVFVAKGRTQLRSGISDSQIRCGIRAYRIEAFADPSLGSQLAPMLAWGDGTITWTAPGAGVAQAGSNIDQAMVAAIADVTGSSAAGNMVQFQPLADGVFRFEVCFLLNDGTLVTVPPTSQTFASLTGGNVYPVALSAQDSADPHQLYVRELVIGVVSLDAATRLIVGSNGSLLPQLADKFIDPAAGQSPMQAWNITTNASLRTSLSPPAFPAPVLGAVQVYQRYYDLN